MFGVLPNTLPLVIYIEIFCYWVLLHYNMSLKTIAPVVFNYAFLMVFKNLPITMLINSFIIAEPRVCTILYLEAIKTKV